MTAADLEQKRAKILDEKRNVTARISETTRFVGFGLVAIYYSIRTSGAPSFGSALEMRFPTVVMLIGLLGVATVLLDYLQYWFGARSVDDALKRESLDYDTGSFWY